MNGKGRTLDYEEIEGEVFLSHIIPAAPVVATVGGGGGSNPGFDIELNDEGDEEVAKQCWEAAPDDDGDVVISWGAVTMSHKVMWDVDAQPLLVGEDLRYGGEDQPERKIPLGDGGDIGAIAYYEFVAEIDDTEHKMTAVVPSDVTSWTIPEQFLALAEPDEGGVREIKFEIIVRVESGEGEDDDYELVESKLGNQSALEDCFELEP